MQIRLAENHSAEQHRLRVPATRLNQSFGCSAGPTAALHVGVEMAVSGKAVLAAWQSW